MTRPYRLSIVKINHRWPPSEEVAVTGEVEVNAVAEAAAEVDPAVEAETSQSLGARDTPPIPQIAVVNAITSTEIKLSTV